MDTKVRVVNGKDIFYIIEKKLLGLFAFFMFVLVLVLSCFADESRQSLKNGNYNVGFRIIKVSASGSEPLVVALWYPTKAKPELSRYISAIPNLQGNVAKDAAPAKGPFPLVIFSHGGIGAGINAMAWAEALAAEGFVVAGIDHKDKTVLVRSDMKRPPTREQKVEALRWAMRLSRGREKGFVEYNEYKHRPGEISATIDALIKVSADKNASLYNLMDSEHIGLTGISFGSWTTSVVAGSIPMFHDRRIKAAIPMAVMAGKIDFSRIRVPLMIIFGEKETQVLLDKRPDAVFKEEGLKTDYEKANPPKFLIGIKGAEHLDFDTDGMITRSSLRKHEKTEEKVYTTAEVRKDDPAIRTIVRYQVAFWRRYLLGDRSAEKILTTQDDPVVYLFKADLINK